MFVPSILRPLPGRTSLLPAGVAGRPLVALDGGQARYLSEGLARDLSEGAPEGRNVWLRIGAQISDPSADLRAACLRAWAPGSDSAAELPELLAKAPAGVSVVLEFDGSIGVEDAGFIEGLVAWIEPLRPRLIVVAEDGHPACLGEVVAPVPEPPVDDVELGARMGSLFQRMADSYPAVAHDLVDAARLWGAETVANALASAGGAEAAVAAVSRAFVGLLDEGRREALEHASRAGYWHPQLAPGEVEPVPVRPWMVELEDGWWWLRPRWRSALSAAFGDLREDRDSGPAPDVASSTVLDARLLGPFEVHLDGHPVNGWSGRVGVNILRYLLTRRDRSCPRDELLAVFWPEVDPAVARNRLQVALSALRRGFREIADEPVVEYRDGKYRIDPKWDVVTDVEEFEQTAEAALLADREGDTDRALALYAEAARIYRGDLAPDTPYEEWCLLLRESYRIRLVDVLDRLCTLLKQQGRIDECIGVAHRLIELDPCREDSHRLLMWCYARQGRTHQATRQYDFCSRVLRATLDMRPSSETVGLLQAIRAGDPIGV